MSNIIRPTPSEATTSEGLKREEPLSPHAKDSHRSRDVNGLEPSQRLSSLRQGLQIPGIFDAAVPVSQLQRQFDQARFGQEYLDGLVENLRSDIGKLCMQKRPLLTCAKQKIKRVPMQSQALSSFASCKLPKLDPKPDGTESSLPVYRRCALKLFHWDNGQPKDLTAVVGSPFPLKPDYVIEVEIDASPEGCLNFIFYVARRKTGGLVVGNGNHNRAYIRVRATLHTAALDKGKCDIRNFSHHLKPSPREPPFDGLNLDVIGCRFTSDWFVMERVDSDKLVEKSIFEGLPEQEVGFFNHFCFGELPLSVALFLPAFTEIGKPNEDRIEALGYQIRNQYGNDLAGIGSKKPVEERPEASK